MFNRYHCDVIITDRLQSLFTSKLWRMGKSLQALGGTGRAKQIKKWKDTKWTVELRQNEIISGRKRKPDNVLIGQSGNYKEKCAKLEGELKEADKKLKVVTNQMKTHEDSSKKVLSALKNVGCSSSSIVVPRKRNKIWSEYSPQYQRKKRKQIANDVQVALSFMKDENFQHSKVELKNRETGEILSVGSDGSTTLERAQTPSDNLVEKTLYIKERFNMSNIVYHELAMVNNALPRSYALTKMVKELDSQSIIRPTPGTTVTGVQQSLTERLRKRIQCLAKSEPSFAPNQHIRVKITSDGTCISHSMHAVVIAFTIIAYEAHPNSPGGNHTIALLNTGEDYNHLSVGLEDICDEIRPLLLMKLSTVWNFFLELIGSF